MTRNEVLYKVIEIVNEHKLKDAPKTTEYSRLAEDLGMDSLDIVASAMYIERRLDIHFDDDEWDKIKFGIASVKDFVDLACKKLNIPTNGVQKNVVQDYDSKKQKLIKLIDDLIENRAKYRIHMSSDRLITTVGNLQIEKLDWRWVDTTPQQDIHVMKFDPYDNKLNHLFPVKKGYFQVVKYGLSGENTLGSYNPLYKWNTPQQEQMKIAMQEMEKMQENGARSSKNGIEITGDSLLWDTVESLSHQCDKKFLETVASMAERKESKGVNYNADELCDGGVTIDHNVFDVIIKLKNQLLIKQVAETQQIKR